MRAKLAFKLTLGIINFFSWVYDFWEWYCNGMEAHYKLENELRERGLSLRNIEYPYPFV
jgi:hypothetical protein